MDTHGEHNLNDDRGSKTEHNTHKMGDYQNKTGSTHTKTKACEFHTGTED